MNDKKYEIYLSVITIMTVLISVVGVSFAYFTGSMNGIEGTVTATTASIGGVTFDGGQDFSTTSTEIEPGWSATKTFSIEAAPSVVDQTIYVKLDYNNGFKDLELKVDGTVGEGDGTNGAKGQINLTKEMKTTDPKVTSTLVEITVPASNETIKYNYILTASFPDNDQNQNYDQGKVFDATLYADLGEQKGQEIYYTHSSPNGTPTKPNPQ